MMLQTWTASLTQHNPLRSTSLIACASLNYQQSWLDMTGSQPVRKRLACDSVEKLPVRLQGSCTTMCA